VTLIDQRILIDAPPQIIWEFISDPYKLAEWHAGYTSVSVLTTQQTGQGTRRRCAVTGGGKDVIEQITAWVEGLGYEYELIEGGPYRAMRGRIRLQPGPDGTSVQWTVEYQPRGPLGLLRDQMSGRKQFAAMMAASLRELRQQVNALGLRMDDVYRARLGIQGRLNAAERAQYQRRHPVPAETDLQPAATPEGAPPAGAEAAAGAPATPGEESAAGAAPAISFDADTEPKPPVGLREAIAAQQENAIPAPTPPPETEEEAPLPPVAAAPEEVPLPPTIAPPPLIASLEPQPPASAPPEEPEPDYRRVTPPRGIPAVLPPAESASPSFARPAPQDAENIPPRPAPPREVPGAPASAAGEQAEQGGTLPPPTPKTDTGEVSIWEVFGLRRPSEQDEDALQGLIQSVEARKAAEQRRETLRRGLKSPLRARLHASASGLRARLALLRARVRAHALRPDR